MRGYELMAHPNRQAAPAKFIDHVQELKRSAIHRLIELEIDRPNVVWIFRVQQLLATPDRMDRFLLRCRGLWRLSSRQIRCTRL